MACAGSSIEGGGEDGARSTAAEATWAAENRLGFIGAVVGAHRVSTAGSPPGGDIGYCYPAGGDDGTHTQTTTERASAVPTTVSLDIPLLAILGSMPAASVWDPVGGAIITPPLTLSAAITGGDSALHIERARVRASLAEFQKYKPPIIEGETTDLWVVGNWVDTMEKIFDELKLDIQRGFVRLASCIPLVSRDEPHKVCPLVDGLRGNIFRVLQSADLQTFQQVVDRAILVERGVVLACARSEGFDRNKGKKRSQSQSGRRQTGGSGPPSTLVYSKGLGTHR